MLEIKDSKQVEDNEHIRFRCTRCAACCRHVKGSVVIDGLDAYRLAQHLKMEVADFISQYADPFLLDEQLWYPIFSLRVKGNDDFCIFLKGSRCTVQDAKPRACRLYPFWVEPNEPDGTTFSYHICFAHRHHPKGSLVRVKDWMDENFGADERKVLQEDFRAMQILAPLLHRSKACGVDDETIFRKLLLHRYLYFSMNEPFFPQQQRNNRILIADLKRMIDAETKLCDQGAEAIHAHITLEMER